MPRFAVSWTVWPVLAATGSNLAGLVSTQYLLDVRTGKVAVLAVFSRLRAIIWIEALPRRRDYELSGQTGQKWSESVQKRSLLELNIQWPAVASPPILSG